MRREQFAESELDKIKLLKNAFEDHEIVDLPIVAEDMKFILDMTVYDIEIENGNFLYATNDALNKMVSYVLEDEKKWNRILKATLFLLYDELSAMLLFYGKILNYKVSKSYIP